MSSQDPPFPLTISQAQLKSSLQQSYDDLPAVPIRVCPYYIRSNLGQCASCLVSLELGEYDTDYPSCDMLF